MSHDATPAPALPGPVTRWTPWVAAAAALVALGAWALVTRAGLAADDDPGIPPVEVLVGALFFGWPHALAAATAVVATAHTAVGADAPARLLALVTSGRRGRRDEWSAAAMRAELASITASPRERLRFAAGCAPTALRRGWGRSPWIVAVACATVFAALTVATSRASLYGSRTGSLWAVIYGPPQITLLLVGLVAAWTGRSMRTGLEHAIAAFAGILFGVLAAAIPEGALWARAAGVFLLDGDAPSTPLTAAGGALDAVKATTLTWGLPHWLPWPMLGAAAGARLRRRTTPSAKPRSTDRGWGGGGVRGVAPGPGGGWLRAVGGARRCGGFAARWVVSAWWSSVAAPGRGWGCSAEHRQGSDAVECCVERCRPRPAGWEP
jgi:hypothetical protein